MESIKESVASLSIEIAEKILEKKLEKDDEQQALINRSLEKLNIK
jgi:F0F1-type ATP synthase membrane subunit b/b'